MANKLLLPAAVVALLPLAARAQNVGIGTSTPNSKAALEIKASDKGLLIPRLTEAQRLAITSPPQGLMVYQTDGTAGGGTQTGFWYYAGTPAAWVFLSPTGDNLGNHSATQDLVLNSNDLKLTSAADDLNKLTFDATTAGPVLTGATGGVLGYRSGSTTTPVLQWANVSGNSRVGIGLPTGTAPNRSLDVNGGVRLRVLTTAGVVTTDATGVLGSAAMPTDNQTLSINSQTLSISGGNSVTLPSGGGSPSGTAGGDLTGTYPNPTLAAGVVATTELADNAVTNAKVADNAINTAELADNAVTSTELASRAVTPAKLATSGTADNTSFLRGDFAWTPLTDAAWSVSGNTLNGSQFIGSLNNEDFVVKRNGNEAFRVYANGRVSLGNNSPYSASLLLGYNAGAGASTALYNTILGSRAGQTTNSNSNTMVGYAAGQSATGNSNTLIGNNAGNRMLSGDNNVFIGNQAGYGSSDTNIGNGNVVIGSSAGGMLNGNSSNNILIGISADANAGLYDAYAIGNNASVTQGNTLSLGGLRGTNDAVNVGIGTSAPKSTLQINGTFAVGVVPATPGTGVGGGTNGSPNNLDQGSLNTQLVGGYFALNPTSDYPYYTLPNAANCPGRIYYVRNIGSVPAKFIVGSGQQLIDGASNTGSTSYDLSTTGSYKSVIMLSDGGSWIVLRTGN